MKSSQLIILVMILLLHYIQNKAIEIQNFEEVKIDGNCEFNYQFSEPVLQDGKSAYFCFMFSDNYGMSIKIRDENGTETSIDISIRDKFICSQITNLKSQNYTFYVRYRWSNEKMFFIDISREINTNLDNFLNFKFDTEYFQDSPPMPLIFKIEFPEDNIFYYENYSDIIYDGYNQLETCELGEGNECKYRGDLIFKKGKTYKIKINCYKNEENQYYFKSIKYTSIIKEIGFGFNIIFTLSTFENNYYIINIKSYQDFYIYLNYTYEYTFLNEDEISENINVLDFISGNTDVIKKMEKEKEYLIFTIKYSSYNNKVLIGIFSELYDYKNLEESFEIKKGVYAIITKDYYEYKNYAIVSSNENMAFLNKEFNPFFLSNALLFGYSSITIYIDSFKEKSLFKTYSFDTDSNTLDIYTNKNLDDTQFSRIHSYSSNFELYTQYYFGVDEQYYIYYKKHYGNIDFYQYNQELNFSSNISELQNPTELYNNKDKFKIVNNELLIISGYKLFKFYNCYGALYDLYIQKVNDLEHVKLNSNKYSFNNLVKLFLPNKTYYLDFTVDHLIKLDNKFLEAEVTFIDSNGEEYILNKNKKVIRDLKGSNIKLETNQNALVYFYKRMEDANLELGMIEFDKSQTGKIMKFNITNIKTNNINIISIKDFGFKGYFPMITQDKWDNFMSYSSRTITIYAENLYDKLDYELYENEGEKYFIYILEYNYYYNTPTFNPNNYNISEYIYLDNLLSSNNKYNFQIIPPNPQGSIILNIKNKQRASYQFMLCESKEIEFQIENAYSYFSRYSYPYKEIINKTKQIELNSINTNEILSHSFKSNKEFIFLYSFPSSSCRYNSNYKILSIYQISNKIQISYIPAYSNCLNYYYVIIAKKNEINNIESFSNQCYLLKMLNKSSNSIYIKKYVEEEGDTVDIEMKELNIKDGDEFIITMINYNSLGSQLLHFYTPFEFYFENKEVIEIKIGEEVQYNFQDKNLFKFNYIYEEGNTGDIYFFFYSFNRETFSFDLYLQYENEKMVKFAYKSFISELFKINLKKSGNYYMQFVSDTKVKNYNIFRLYVPGGTIETIDLSQRMYFMESKIQQTTKYESNKYKVKNLKEDKYVYFTYTTFLYNVGEQTYNNPFEVCNDKTNECTKNVTIYKFLKQNEYSIYINFINEINSRSDSYYYYPSYIFIPIFSDTIEDIEEGYYTITIPKIFNINLKNKVFLGVIFRNSERNYASTSNQKISQDNINKFKLDPIYDSTALNEKNGNNNGIILTIPSIKDNKEIMVIVNNVTYNQLGKYSTKAEKNEICLLYNSMYEKDYNIKIPLQESYNVLTTISSPIEHLKVLNLESPKSYNYLLYNSIIKTSPTILYFDKIEKSTNLEFKLYLPRYAFFAVFNINWTQSYLKPLLSSYIYNLIKFDLKELLPLNFRVNSDYMDFYEFFNFLFYNSENNINIYIKKFYGGTEFYECDADSTNINDLTFITKPISSCKNKKSIFNRIIKLDGTKLLSGYLDYNSYFDIYVDIDNDENKDIVISKFSEYYRHNGLNTFNFKHTSKYLKKGVEYNIAFIANHLIKLEPGFDAEISIYKNKEILSKINITNPTLFIKGSNITIKSNNDAMVYFYSKLLDEFVQTKIEPKKGKNIKIELSKTMKYVIDFGFEGYNPTNIFSLGKLYNDNNGTIYLENLYDKLQNKLIDGEFLYLYTCNYNYYPSQIDIYYNYTSLNKPKNDYTFDLIKSTTSNKEDNKTYIIHNDNKDLIIYQIYYCKSPHPIKMYFQMPGYNEALLEFGEGKQIYNISIPHNSIELKFESTQDFIFSFSFIDPSDLIVNNFDEWKKERVINDNLKIEEIYKKNNGNISTIQFNPNYSNSSTKYYIIIALKDENNSLINFANPCYITELITEKKENIKVFIIFDIGENLKIEADIDISDIINDSREYIVNIISQELRFEKKLNYYTPFTFIPKNINNKNNDNNDNNDNDSNLFIYIICISSGVVLIIIILIIIIVCSKKKTNKDIDFYKETKTLDKENLLKSI